MNLRFECQRGCINCCDQEGFVYLTKTDLKRAAKFTGMSARAFESKYVYRTAHTLRFRKPPDKQCPFLEGHGCGIHPAKPTQCRTFPFWPELVEDPAAWKRTSRFCPGIGKGPLIQIGTAMEIAEVQRKAYPDDYK
ncbi:MAG TPA: YkgJ family cysteine cluster protein [Bryobacteraceae bacterium]|jgi:Fe-S-cluster containining protein|nr:YkgJ family cysteine cluster protein [Bryobacteraceae bacterium]